MAIEEIVVTRKRREGSPPFSGVAFQNRISASPAGRGSLEKAFVAPVVPEVIQEIVATAKRPPKLPLTGIGGAVVGLALIGAEIARSISQGRLEEAWRTFENVKPRKKDTPVFAQPVMDEITVTAKRPTVFPAPVRAPYTFIPFDADPTEMQFIRPFLLPTTPAAVAAPDVLAPEIPDFADFPLEIPQTLPTVAQPATRTTPDTIADPLSDPLSDPLADPLADPSPGVFADPGTSVDPQTFAGPLTSGQPRAVGYPFALPFPLAQPDFAGANCPPCPPCKDRKKKREKERKRCYKKLVKEGRFPSQDTGYRWTEISCFTGKEI